MMDGVLIMMVLNCRGRKDGVEAQYWLSGGTNASIGAALQAALNYSKANPNMWGDHYIVGVANGVASSFPCQK